MQVIQHFVWPRFRINSTDSKTHKQEKGALVEMTENGFGHKNKHPKYTQNH